MRALAALIVVSVTLAGCNRNSSLGNDREAQVDPAPTPAPAVAADAALENVSTAILKPQTMSRADIAALGGLAGKCAVRLTEVAHPSFVYRAGERGTIKLNGKLVTLPATGAGGYSAGRLSVTLRPNGERGNAGLDGIDMLVVLPGAKDELGYSGFVDCEHGTAE